MTPENDQSIFLRRNITIPLLIGCMLLPGIVIGAIVYVLIFLRYPTDVEAVVWISIIFVTSFLAFLCALISLMAELKTSRKRGKLWILSIFFGLDLLLLIVSAIPAGFVLMINLDIWLKRLK